MPAANQPIVHQTQSRLLSLPPELLTMICEFAVITSTDTDGDRVECDSSGAVGPPLLRSCRLLRNISTLIFWLRNSFEIEIFLYNARPLLEWCAMAPPGIRQTYLAQAFVLDSNDGTLWYWVHEPTEPVLARINLMAWLKAMWTMTGKGSFGTSHLPEYDATDFFHRLWRVHDAARTLKIKGTTWSEAQPLLSMAIDVAGVLGER